jgi:hypothetical protein
MNASIVLISTPRLVEGTGADQQEKVPRKSFQHHPGRRDLF